ncbi:MAG: hypothetical protein DKM50_10685 [Candidatus Margulisiibacteriota bacterium]|nr:MAG: hypothetical protein DKM50_10685 [Candidatus Margulisiibacteriota bacterium]HAR63317.1 hypothetical protein [Candidatus Margulisiibacteriota bacterium]HCY36633.1 hypothetical protein [Candidatus Margulisiibacteriota bacterium]
MESNNTCNDKLCYLLICLTDLLKKSCFDIFIISGRWTVNRQPKRRIIMLHLGSFGEYIKHYRTSKELNQIQLADKMEISAAFITNIENKGTLFSEEKMEKFAQLMSLDEISYNELLLQRTIDHYEIERNKRFFKNLKKMLPLYERIQAGNFDSVSFEDIPSTPSTGEIISQIKLLIGKIPDEQVKKFLATDIDYAEQKFSS